MNVKKTVYPYHTLQDTNDTIRDFAYKYKNDVIPKLNLKLRDFFDYVAKDIQYEKDPKNIEMIQRPKITMIRRKGDCDCKTVLFLAYLIKKGITCGFSVVAEKGKKDFHHVFPFMIIPYNNKMKKFDLDATYWHNRPFITKPWGKREDRIIFTNYEV